MLKSISHRKFTLIEIDFNRVININPLDIGLEKNNKQNLYTYNSKGFDILYWKIKPKIVIRISKTNNCLKLQVENNHISGIGDLSKLIRINIETRITGSPDYCFIDRSIILEVYNDRGFIKFIPEYLIQKLLKEALVIVSNRFDKRLSNIIKNI